MSESNLFFIKQWNRNKPNKTNAIQPISLLLAPTVFSAHFGSPAIGCAPHAFENSLKDFGIALNGNHSDAIDDKTREQLEPEAIKYIDSIVKEYFAKAIQEGRPKEEVFNALEPWLKNATAEIKTDRFSSQEVNMMYDKMQNEQTLKNLLSIGLNGKSD